MSNIRKVFNLNKLMRSQWLQHDELCDLQNKKIKSMVKYAYENIPMYHRKFRASKIFPEDIKSIEDLQKLPYTTKSEIQANFPENIIVKSVNLKKCWHSRTSGSTGNPLTVVYDEAAEDFEKATALRPNLSCGQSLFDRWVMITSSDHIVQKKWFQRLGMFSPEYISLFDRETSKVSMLERLKPDVLDGYSSSIYLIAKEIEQENCRNIIRPKLIFGTAELLTRDMRQYINSTFDTNMFDQFGCVEMGRTAWECPEHSGYHIDMEAVAMEFIKDGEQVSSGERGEIVYTNLYNYAMPFIRYKIGDVGIPTDDFCPCGRGLPLMRIIEGRSDSFIRVPSGRIFSPIIWTILLRPYSLDQFKVVQKKIDRINIQIVPGQIFDQDTIGQIKEKSKELLGEEVYIDVEIVDEIPKVAGKVRSVISEI